MCITSDQVLKKSLKAEVKIKEEVIDELPEVLVNIAEIMQPELVTWIKNEVEDVPEVNEVASFDNFEQQSNLEQVATQVKNQTKVVNKESKRKICPVCGKIYSNWHLSIHMESHIEKSSEIKTGPPSKKSKGNRNIEQIKKERKAARQSGNIYVDYSGIAHKKRLVKAPCIATCHLKCCLRLSAEQRLEAHKQFWSLNDPQKVKFYNEHLVKKPVHRRSTTNPEKLRDFTVRYHLTVDDKLEEVCRKMFVNTLDISVSRIYHFMKSKDGEADVEYKHGHHKVINDEDINAICTHIRSVPLIKIGDENYADGFPSLSKLYENYVQLNEAKHRSYSTYRKLFLSEFKISFLHPKIAQNL